MTSLRNTHKMNFGHVTHVLQESAAIPKKPLALWLTSAPRTQVAVQHAPSSHGIAPGISPQQHCLRKALKHHLCPGKTLASLRLRSNNKKLKLVSEGNTNSSKPDRGTKRQSSLLEEGPSHQ